MRHTALGVIANETLLSMEVSLNRFISEQPRKIFLKTLGFYFDTNMIEKGLIVGDKFTSILMDGSASTHKNHTSAKNYTLMPIHDPTKEDI